MQSVKKFVSCTKLYKFFHFRRKVSVQNARGSCLGIFRRTSTNASSVSSAKGSETKGTITRQYVPVSRTRIPSTSPVQSASSEFIVRDSSATLKNVTLTLMSTFIGRGANDLTKTSQRLKRARQKTRYESALINFKTDLMLSVRQQLSVTCNLYSGI